MFNEHNRHIKLCLIVGFGISAYMTFRLTLNNSFFVQISSFVVEWFIGSIMFYFTYIYYKKIKKYMQKFKLRI